METCYWMRTEFQLYMVRVSQDWHERKLTDTRCYLLSTTEGSFLASLHLSFFLNIYLAVLGLYFSKRDLAPQPGIEPGLPVFAARSLSRWTTRQIPSPWLSTRETSQPLVQASSCRGDCPSFTSVSGMLQRMWARPVLEPPTQRSLQIVLCPVDTDIASSNPSVEVPFQFYWSDLQCPLSLLVYMAEVRVLSFMG